MSSYSLKIILVALFTPKCFPMENVFTPREQKYPYLPVESLRIRSAIENRIDIDMDSVSMKECLIHLMYVFKYTTALVRVPFRSGITSSECSPYNQTLLCYCGYDDKLCPSSPIPSVKGGAEFQSIQSNDFPPTPEFEKGAVITKTQFNLTECQLFRFQNCFMTEGSEDCASGEAVLQNSTPFVVERPLAKRKNPFAIPFLDIFYDYRNRFRSVHLSEGCKLRRNVIESHCNSSAGVMEQEIFETSGNYDLVTLNHLSLEFTCECAGWPKSAEKNVAGYYTPVDHIFVWIITTAGSMALIFGLSVLISRNRSKDWTVTKTMDDVQVPPNGKSDNGDSLKSLESLDDGMHSASQLSLEQNPSTGIDCSLDTSVYPSRWNTPSGKNLESATLIGTGSYGKVFRVVFTISKCEMALKIVRLDAANTNVNNDKDKILREVKHMSEVDHPNVVKMHEYWSELHKGETTRRLESFSNPSVQPGDTLFILMDLCTSNLQEWLILHPAMSDRVPHILAMFTEIAGGLKAMHDMRICHRDIKPNNILYVENKDGTKTWKIGDLGLSRHIGTQKQTLPSSIQSHAGCASYQSPEMSRKSKYSCKTDIFSLGLVFLEVLCPELMNWENRCQTFALARRIPGMNANENNFQEITGLMVNQYFTNLMKDFVFKMLEIDQYARFGIDAVVSSINCEKIVM